MATNDKTRIYCEIAERYHSFGQETLRDRYLVLAADAAFAAQQPAEAERLRSHLLQLNPHHLLKPYASFQDAINSLDVQNYIAALRRNHPFEKAEYLLSSLRPPASEPAKLPDDIKVLPLASSEPGQAKETTPSRNRLAAALLAPFSSGKKVSPAGVSGNARQVSKSKTPEVYPIRLEPDWKNTGARELEPDSRWSPDAMISSLLLAIVFLGGVALAVYTLARPFLPENWLP